MATMRRSAGPIARRARRLRKLLAAALVLVVESGGASPLFDDTAVLDVALSGPLESVIDDRSDRQERPFLLHVAGREQVVQVRVRGKSRARICRFPPLRLRFAADDTQDSPFSGQGKLKLVTHCGGGRFSETDALEEYAVYRIFNLVSDVSYRVRLLRITWTDTDPGGDEPFERYGFLIEPSRSLAARIGGTPVDTDGVQLSALNERQAAAMYVFQYLVGNTDWSLAMAEDDDTCCHNVDLFDVGSEWYAVPYDFDLAGLVNARYARPDQSLRISRVTQRLYRGYCLSREALAGALVDIRGKRSDILGVLDDLPGLSPKDRKSRRSYLERFFDKAENEEKLLRNFEKACL